MRRNEETIPTPAAHAADVAMEDETVLLDRTTGALHLLNDTGAAIWGRLDGSRTVGSIVAELSETFEAEPDSVARDVHEFLSRLAKLGLVEGWTTHNGVEPGPKSHEAAVGPSEPAREAPDDAAWSLDTVWVDWYTAQVVEALRSRGVEAILLKGPAIKDWLYRDSPGLRGYIDADLLVAAGSLTSAATVLSELGFEREDTRGMDPINLWADSWRRAGDGAVIDLHRTLHGCEYAEVDPWPILRASAVEEKVGGTAVLVPSIPARAVGLVLVSPADRPWRRWHDVERALEQLPVDGWRQAAAIARALGVEREFGYRLSQSPAGAECAKRIGVPTAPPRWLRWETDPILRWVALLTMLPSWRQRLRLARHLILPPLSYVRFRDREAADRGPVRSYAAWALHVMRLLPGAILTLLRSLGRIRDRDSVG